MFNLKSLKEFGICIFPPKHFYEFVAPDIILFLAYKRDENFTVETQIR